jgi:formate dehydrogenase maturation protein FdhE
MSKKKSIEQKYYKVRVRCFNCSRWLVLEIPMGTKLLVYLKNNTCENCGCAFVKNLADWKRISIISESGF